MQRRLSLLLSLVVACSADGPSDSGQISNPDMGSSSNPDLGALDGALDLGALDLGASDIGVDAGPADAGPDLPYDRPADFDRSGCTPGSLAGFDPQGVWHLDQDFGGGFRSGQALRIDRDQAGLSAIINFERTRSVDLTEDDLFARLETMTNPFISLAAYDVCRVDDNGIFGKAAICNPGGQCASGTFTGVKVDRIPSEQEGMGLRLVGEWGGGGAWGIGAPINVRVLDGVAYLARQSDGLRIIDVSDPAAPMDLGHAPTGMPQNGELYGDVKVHRTAGGRTFALMASNLRGVVPIDVTDPANPVEMTPFPGPITNVHTLFTETIGQQTFAYLANFTTSGLGIWDVTDPAAPVEVGAWVHPQASSTAFLHDLYAESGRLYLNYWQLGLVVIDTQPDPSNPQLVGAFSDYPRRTSHSNWVTTTSGGRKVSVTGDEDWGAHVRIIDVDEQSPTFMEQLGEFSLRPEVSVHNIMAIGDRAYVAHYQDGFRLLDISDPTAPTQLGYYNTWSAQTGGSFFFEGAAGVDVDPAAGLIYVADSWRGLIILTEEP